MGKKESQKRYREKNKRRLYLENRKYLVENPWYSSWTKLKDRCRNKNAHNYKWYGGKGIKVRISREEIAYLWGRDNASSLRRPTIDRIDSDKDYCISNCRFIEASENTRRAASKRGRR